MQIIEKPKNIGSLTGLRFFAAAAIVWFHYQGSFNLPKTSASLAQGVSYFFVLSGFVLAHVYPSVPNWSARAQFMIARIARLWPAHLAGIMMMILLVGAPWQAQPLNLVVNILMLQAWIPVEGLFTSVNGPSWSISTELGLYFIFLVVVDRFKDTRGRMLILSFVVLAALVALGLAMNVPWVTKSPPSITAQSLLYEFPFGRAFEFASGMCVAELYRRWSLPARLSFLSVTAIEIAVVGLIVGHAKIAACIVQAWPNALTYYISFSAALPAAISIFVFSQNRGLISKFLATPLCVLLGEMSYSIYLYHVPLGYYFSSNRAQITSMTTTRIVCLMALAALCYASLTLFETPARVAIRRATSGCSRWTTLFRCCPQAP